MEKFMPQTNQPIRLNDLLLSNFNTMHFDIRDRVGYLTFTRPDSMNSLSPTVYGEFETLLDYLEADEELRALVITGTGKAFSVGLDLEVIKRGFVDLVYFETVVRQLHRILLRLEALPLPIIAAVNGYARAGGWEIVLCCDLVLVAEEAKVGDAHSTYAVAPGGGASQRLPRIVGMQRAKELIWTGRWMTSTQMVEYGLALAAVPLAQLPEAVEDLLKEIRNKPRKLLAVTKKMMMQGIDLPLAESIELETSMFFDYMRSTTDPLEGVHAWLEKREPSWK
jgi:enoyl-CoA hydratase/carnithine racemase